MNTSAQRPVGDYAFAEFRRGWLFVFGFVTALLLLWGGGAVLRFLRWMFD